MAVIEAVLGRPVITEPGGDPYVRADPLAVSISGHDFDDADIHSPTGMPLALKTAYPHLIEVRDTEGNLQRQQDAAALIFAAIKADGQFEAVLIDDMQHVVDFFHAGPS